MCRSASATKVTKSSPKKPSIRLTASSFGANKSFRPVSRPGQYQCDFRVFWEGPSSLEQLACLSLSELFAGFRHVHGNGHRSVRQNARDALKNVGECRGRHKHHGSCHVMAERREQPVEVPPRAWQLAEKRQAIGGKA